MDIMGKIVMQFSNLQQEKLELDLSNLNKGIYFIKARKGNQDVVKKFILQ
jgi:hypothetical protein